ncbi:MAG: hypothetical protein JXA69_18535 [Phycisphaerae bacterium]|nr:hypothetical protein [Phycisphaerae bacterium]
MIRRLASVGIVLGVAVAPAAADEIRTTSQARYAAVRIEDVAEGKLFFRDVQGRVVNRPLADVAELTITGWEPFNRAEAALAQKQYRQAMRDYQALLDETEPAGPGAGRPKHRRELVLARLLVACDAEGRFDRAVDCFIMLCNSWGEAAAPLVPRNVPSDQSSFHVIAVNNLNAALATSGERASAAPLRRLHATLTGQPTTQPTAETRQSETDAERLSQRLTERLDRITKWFEAGRLDEAEASVRTGLRGEAIEHHAVLYYWLGRCQEAGAKTNEAMLNAALAYMRVAIHYPDNRHAAECLYRTAMLHKQAGLPARIAPLLREALRRNPDAALRAQCEAALGSVAAQ